MRHLSVALLILALASSAMAHDRWPSKKGGGSGTPAVVNQAQDTDEDGSPDYIACSDKDDDGTLEAKDIQDCINALTDTSGRTVVVVGPGTYIYADTPSTFYNSGTSRGLVQLPDNTTLECAPGVMIQMWPNTIDEAADEGYGFINANKNGPTNNHDIIVRGCRVDGGAPTSSFTLLAGHSRIAYSFQHCDNCHFEYNYAQNTLHSGYYVRNGAGLFVENNRCFQVGSYFSSTDSTGFPCVYMFAENANTTQQVHVTHNESRKSGTSAWNARRACAGDAGCVIPSTLDILKEVYITDNYAEDVGAPNQAVGFQVAACINTTSIDGAVIANNRCVRSGGFSYANSVTAFGMLGAEGVNGVRNILVDGNTFIDQRRPTELHEFSENVRFTNNHVQMDLAQACSGAGSCHPAIKISTPMRGLVISGNRLSASGDCITFDGGNSGTETPDDPREAIMISNNDMSRCDGLPGDTDYYSGITFSGENQHHINILNNRITGYMLYGIGSRGGNFGCVECVIEGNVIDGTPVMYMGSGLFSARPTCNAASKDVLYTITAATDATTCDGGDGSGDVPNICRCDGVSTYVDENDFPAFSPGIWLASTSTNTRISNNRISNVQLDYGIYLNDAAGAGIRVEGIQAVEESGIGGFSFLGDMVGAVSVNGGTATTTLTNLQVQATCVGTSATNCVQLANTDPNIEYNDFAPGQVFIQALSPVPTTGGAEGPCQSGQQYRRTDDTAGDGFLVCQNDVWVQK